MLRKAKLIVLPWLFATLLTSCQNTSPKLKPAPTSSSNAITAPSTVVPAAAALWAGLPLPSPQCLEYCKREDATEFRANRWCGGAGNQLMDLRYDTPVCGGASGDLEALWQVKPAQCDCLPAPELVERGETRRECRQLCTDVLPFYDEMAQRCAGKPEDANYGNPECGPAAERLFQRFPYRKLSYCNCGLLTLHVRLMQQRGKIR